MRSASCPAARRAAPNARAAWEQADKAEKLRMACAELEDERT